MHKIIVTQCNSATLLPAIAFDTAVQRGELHGQHAFLPGEERRYTVLQVRVRVRARVHSPAAFRATLQRPDCPHSCNTPLRYNANPRTPKT